VNNDLNSVRSKKRLLSRSENEKDVKYINNSIELKGSESLTQNVTQTIDLRNLDASSKFKLFKQNIKNSRKRNELRESKTTFKIKKKP
jgi:hypothetical protein